MLVDTGQFMSDERSYHGELRPDAAVKNDWILRAYNEFPVDVVNVSSHDLRYFSKLLKTQVEGARVPLNRLVSANIVSESSGVESLRPFVIREVSARVAGGVRKLRAAFVGLTETRPAPPPGFKFVDTLDAARRTVPAARKNADLLIVLAKVSTEEAGRIAREVPGIDVIIAGNAVTLEQVFTPPTYAGKTLIAFTPYETRMLGELRFYVNGQGSFTTRQRFISLDELLVPSDSAAKRLADDAAKAETETRSESKKRMENWLANSNAFARNTASERQTGGYTGSNACSQCHLAQYMKWANGPHAQATNPLVSRPVEFEMNCLACHATGAAADNRANGFAGVEAVGCEACHGPGGSHVKSPGKGYGRVAKPSATCTACHTSQTSPAFELPSYWEKIKH